MKRFILFMALYAIATTFLSWHSTRSLIDERRRHTNNILALNDSILFYRTELGESVASCRVLELRIGELKRLNARERERLRRMELRLRDVESHATTATETSIQKSVVLRDTVILHDSVRSFLWRDDWVTIGGTMSGDSVMCNVQSIDTLRQTVSRIPRKIWFIRFGTKALQQQITSSNPHSQIVYTEYIKISHRRERRR